MEKVGLFYGSDSGTTQEVAESITKCLGNVTLYDVAKAKKEDLSGYKNLILAAPTYGSGDLQDDWDDFLGTLKEEDFEGKTIALVGLGDQDTYGDTFCDGLQPIYAKAHKLGKIVGYTETAGYDYEASTAVVDNQFVGLIIDQVNQEELTQERIEKWCDILKQSF